MSNFIIYEKKNQIQTFYFKWQFHVIRDEGAKWSARFEQFEYGTGHDVKEWNDQGGGGVGGGA